jgi:gas vesicle protein GvpL/GvpF
MEENGQVPPRRTRADELARWAADRAPELLAEAERQAVEVLRHALVQAATQGMKERVPPPAEAASPAVPPRSSEEASEKGELLWVYGILRSTDPSPADLPGVSPSGAVEREEASGLVALVSPVPAAEFGAEPLRKNLNDLEWLERVARAHEAVLEAVIETGTIVPLRMCTLYESRESVRGMLERERAGLISSLAVLDGRLEWAVKVTVDRERLRDAARAASPTASMTEQAVAGRGEGSAYMADRRADRQVRELAGSMAAEIAEQVHARLQDWAIDAVTRPPQNRELSGHQGEMVLNGAYLVDRHRADELRRLVSELQTRHQDLGARIELTGPWPPYNFVPREAGALE